MTEKPSKAVSLASLEQRALRPRARLLRTLGSELISSDKVALIELVKNSYDADASVSIIRFIGPLHEGEGRIEVWDDGHGMNAETLRNSWLDIATDTKSRNPWSDEGRRVLGEKGIGRLAASRLGRHMQLTTRRHNAQEISLTIDWTQFDQEDLYLDEVKVEWEIGKPKIFTAEDSPTNNGSGVQATAVSQWPHGTLIRMDHLTKSWNIEDVFEVRTALNRLMKPRPSKIEHEVDLDFQIFLEFDQVPDDIQALAGPVDVSAELQTPHYSLTGSVDKKGIAELVYEQLSPPKKEVIGTKSIWNNNKRPPECGPFEFEINVWDRDTAALRSILDSDGGNTAIPSTKDLKGFRDTLSEVAGVSIFRDGFRVLPFGESGDDWLGLDLRRVQSPTKRVSNNQVVGHIFIGADTNKELRDQSNREGILAGEAYADLQLLVKAVLHELELRRYTARRPKKDSAQEKRKGMFRRFSLGDVRSVLVKNHPQDESLLALFDEKDREIQQAVAEVQNVLSRYSRLATLGTLIDRVLHDGRTVVTRLKNISNFGLKDLNKKKFNDQEKLDISRQAMDQTKTQADRLSALFTQIEPFGGRKRGRPRSHRLIDLVDKSIAILRQEADDNSVLVSNECSDTTVKLDDSELITVLVNLIQNAIYWTSTQPVSLERRVVVANRMDSPSSMTLIVSDTGPGVPEDLREHIFDPYFSDKPEGVGLGLSIVGNIVEEIYEGKLTLVEEGPLNGATFEALFRKRVV